MMGPGSLVACFVPHVSGLPVPEAAQTDGRRRWTPRKGAGDG